MSRNRTRFVSTLGFEGGGHYFDNVKYPEIPLSINDIYVITQAGDRLDLLAENFYKDVRLWWIISTANMNKIRRDSFHLEPGLEIRIPIDTTNIIRNFEILNKNL